MSDSLYARLLARYNGELTTNTSPLRLLAEQTRRNGEEAAWQSAKTAIRLYQRARAAGIPEEDILHLLLTAVQTINARKRRELFRRVRKKINRAQLPS